MKYEWIQDRTGATKAQVDMFIRWAKKSQMLTTQKTTRGMIVSITNYDVFQTLDNYKNDTENEMKTIRKRQGTKVSKKEKKETSSQNLELAGLLLTSILNRRNGFKKPNLESWAKNIDLMIQVDKRQPDEIEKVIIWCQKDEFWQDNILSTAKLRKQFDQLALKMAKTKQKIDDEPSYW